MGLGSLEKLGAEQAARAENSGQRVAPGSVKQSADWYSGWCGTGPCRDSDSPEGKRLCRYRAENGALVAVRFLHCSCLCHAGARHPDDPHYDASVDTGDHSGRPLALAKAA